MTSQEFTEIKERFAGYIDGFRSENGILEPMLQLKLEHCEKVEKEALELSTDLGWSSSDQCLAGVLGLVHDIGRFSQFTDFRTFSDAASVDHGKRGREIASHIDLFSGLGNMEQAVLLDGIAFHNVREIPDGLPVRSLLFVSMIRDCDKLDIYRIVLASVKKDGFKDLPNMLPEVKLDRTVCGEMVGEFRQGKSCNLSAVKTLGDFLLMQLSWMYDFSYKPTLKKVVDRGILNDLLANIEFSGPGQNVQSETLQFISNTLNSQTEKT